MAWFQIGKGVCQGCTLSPCLFNLYTEYNLWNARLNESQAGIKTARRNINNLRYAGDNTLMAESEEELKSLMMKVKEKNEKAGLKLNIQKTKIMASGPIPSWQIGKQWKQWQTSFSQVPTSLQIVTEATKLRHLLLGRKAIINLDSIFKVKLLSRVRLCESVDCSLPGSSVHGILQARILEWVAISFSRGSSQPRDRTQVFHIAGRCFTLWATLICQQRSV